MAPFIWLLDNRILAFEDFNNKIYKIRKLKFANSGLKFCLFIGQVRAFSMAGIPAVKEMNRTTC
jgi:hypothetical protein